MILSHAQIEDIAAAAIKDFNEFFFGTENNRKRLIQATPIDQFARDYLGLEVSFAQLSVDGSICGLTAYTDTEYTVEEIGATRRPLRFYRWLCAVCRRGHRHIPNVRSKPDMTGSASSRGQRSPCR